MIGGEEEVVARLSPIFASIAPGPRCRGRTPGRSGEPSQAEHGYYHCGPNGAGHFVKMVHNGIEYGVMAAYAEGLNIIANADMGKRQRAMDAETAPLERPELYQYEIDTTEVAEVWRRGSVIGSWLLDLTAAALHDSPKLEEFAGRVSDSGEGRWTSIAAIEEGHPGARAHGGALLAVRVAQHGRLREPPPVGDAQAVRRPRREEGLSSALEIEILPDAESVARRGAEIVAAAAAEAVADRGRFELRRLGRAHALGDVRGPRGEDALGEGDDLPGRRTRRARRRPDRNLTQLQRALPPGGAATCARCRSRSTTSRPPRPTTRAPPEAFDLVHLGLGPTATRRRSSRAIPCSR
jgi:hypothetical protein